MCKKLKIQLMNRNKNLPHIFNNRKACVKNTRPQTCTYYSNAKSAQLTIFMLIKRLNDINILGSSVAK